MSEPTAPNTPRLSRSGLAIIAALTIVGAILRGWGLGRIGLTHFDEGIYALAGTWVFDPGGLSSLSPTLIAYAPPGLAILIGLGYVFAGSSDLIAMAPSLIAGIATIPVVAWLARRTFGPGAGVAAAALVALSGPHIAFSRMALTDALYLFAWLVAIGAGQRFLERPGLIRAIMLGVAVGLAQQCKYNGWLAGGIVAATALVGVATRAEERRPARIARVFGWGLLAAFVAAGVVWPWYRFVESHGGYASLLRHQRSYLGGFSTWAPHFAVQFQQSVALSGGWRFLLVGESLAVIGLILTRLGGEWRPTGDRIRTGGAWIGMVLAGVVLVNAPWWACLAVVPSCLGSERPARRLFGVGWVVLAILTPFYHPYARLWLPLHAAGWIAVGGWYAAIGRSNPPVPISSRLGTGGNLDWLVVVAIGCVVTQVSVTGRSVPLSGLLAPSDSVRGAVELLVAQLPGRMVPIKVLARPPVSYYLGNSVIVLSLAGPEALARPADPSALAIYDAGLSAEPVLGDGLPEFLREDWAIVGRGPTTLSLPALLDIHPDAANATDDARVLRNAPLWLIRPKRARDRR